MLQRAAVRSIPFLVAACGGASPPATAPASPPPAAVAPPPTPTAATTVEPLIDAGLPPPPTAPQLTGKAIPLPGVTPPASLDYLASDRAHAKVWVPVGNTGSVDVLDAATGAFTRVDGFKFGEREMRGKKRMVGPSAATVGDGVVYVADRFTSEVCPVDTGTLRLGKCLKLAASTDGVSYVASTKEVWVTTPATRSLAVLDASKPAALKPKTAIEVDGSPEGYAVDDGRGVFYTNLEDRGGTVVIDVHTHRPKATWKAGCGDDGPRGLATDAARGLVFVACTDRVVVLDATHDGAVLSQLDTGAGVDNIDWLEGHGLLYVAASKAARLTIARFDDKGMPTVVATGTTADGARNPVADATGNAYVADPKNGGVLVFPFVAP